MLCRLLATTALCSLLPAQRVLEGAEPNDGILTATVLPCGHEAVGSLQSFLDDDWYRVTLSAPSDLFLATGPGTALRSASA